MKKAYNAICCHWKTSVQNIESRDFISTLVNLSMFKLTRTAGNLISGRDKMTSAVTCVWRLKNGALSTGQAFVFTRVVILSRPGKLGRAVFIENRAAFITTSPGKRAMCQSFGK